jgi:hypothetical protein
MRTDKVVFQRRTNMKRDAVVTKLKVDGDLGKALEFSKLLK